MNFEILSKNSEKKNHREEMAKMALANERQILKKSSIKVRNFNQWNYMGENSTPGYVSFLLGCLYFIAGMRLKS